MAKKKIKIRVEVFSGGLKQSEKIIEVNEYEAERLLNKNSNGLNIFYTKIDSKNIL